MSVTSGFYNSLNGDRKYNAEQMSALFDGIINDGVLASIGTAFAVTPGTGNAVNVGIGRAWFNNIWIYNDSILPIELEESEILLDRYDAIVLEVNKNDSVRAADIKVVKGTPASSPVKPTMIKTTYMNQYPLAYILRKKETTKVTKANITIAVGTAECPYVTGLLQVKSIDDIVEQWQAQWNEWFEESSNHDSEWMTNKQNEFTTWFESLQTVLDEDTAARLAGEIMTLRLEMSNKSDVGHIHEQYLTEADGDARYSKKDHNHDDVYYKEEKAYAHTYSCPTDVHPSRIWSWIANNDIMVEAELLPKGLYEVVVNATITPASGSTDRGMATIAFYQGEGNELLASAGNLTRASVPIQPDVISNVVATFPIWMNGSTSFWGSPKVWSTLNYTVSSCYIYIKRIARARTQK